MGEGDLGVAGVRGVEGVVVMENGESNSDEADVDEREAEVCLLGESRTGMTRGGRRGRLWKLCAELGSSLIFLPRSIITIG